VRKREAECLLEDIFKRSQVRTQARGIGIGLGLGLLGLRDGGKVERVAGATHEHGRGAAGPPGLYHIQSGDVLQDVGEGPFLKCFDLLR
jgi:hypothetical protein